MKTTITLCLAVLFSTFYSKAQCYHESISIFDWIQNSCLATQHSFYDCVDTMPPDMLCVGTIGDINYIVFHDEEGNRHLVYTGDFSSQFIEFAIFKGKSLETVVMGRFRLKTCMLKKNSLYIKEGAYSSIEFQDWNTYLASFAPHPAYGIH